MTISKVASTTLLTLEQKPHILTINRSVPFNPAKFIEPGCSIFAQDDRMSAVTEIDPGKIIFRHHLHRGEGQILGEDKLKREKDSGVLRFDALAIQALYKEPGQKTLKVLRSLGWTWFEGLGTELCYPDGRRFALNLRYLASHKWWHKGYLWLAAERYTSTPSASLKQ
jgi:hypothetical protein